MGKIQSANLHGPAVPLNIAKGQCIHLWDHRAVWAKTVFPKAGMAFLPQRGHCRPWALQRPTGFSETFPAPSREVSHFNKTGIVDDFMLYINPTFRFEPSSMLRSLSPIAIVLE